MSGGGTHVALDMERHTEQRVPTFGGWKPLVHETAARRAPVSLGLVRDIRGACGAADVLTVLVVAVLAGAMAAGGVAIAVAMSAPRRRQLSCRTAHRLPALWFTILALALLSGRGPLPSVPPVVLGGAGLLATALRAAVGAGVQGVRRRGSAARRALVVGDGPAADRLAEALRLRSELGFRDVVGIGGEHVPEPLAEMVAVATDAIEHLAVTDVFVMWSGDRSVERAVALAASAPRGIAVWGVPAGQSFLLHPGMVEHVSGLPMVDLGPLSPSRRLGVVKRVLDVVVASVALVLLSPLLLAAAVTIRLGSPGPVLFRQPRIGRGGTPFQLLKFRSMVDAAADMVIDLRDQNEADGNLFKLRDDPRVTPIGRLLRRYSIDELPQLLNVIRGDMSLVGPRPLPVIDARYGPVDVARLNVRPGITGLWQILGRSDVGYAQMIDLDLTYLQRSSVLFDAEILVRTVSVVARGEGAY